MATTNALLSAFARRRDRDPGAPVVASVTSSISAQDLHDLATAVSNVLPDFEPGAVVGLRASNGAAFLAGWLALLRRGAAPLLHDCRQPAPETGRVAAALGARGLLIAADPWPASASAFRWIELAPTPAAVALDGIAAIKLTSGSTGAPRGIAAPAAALLADDEQLWTTMGLGPRERMLTAIPLSHSYGLSSLAVPALVRDATLLVGEEAGPFAPLLDGRALAATFFPTAPAWLAALSRLRQPPPFPETLRLLISAGEPLAPEVAARLRQRMGRRVHVFYGSSETGGITFDREGGAAERGTVGTPIEGVAVDLADGRVVVSSAAVASGYLPDADARLGDGRFLTGDLGAWTDRGELRLLGRADDLLFVKGKSVNPREVESVLRRLPGVEDAAVFAVPDLHGEGQRIRAVLAAPPGLVRAAEATAFCRQHLAEHQVPREMVIVRALPRSERGKLDRAALHALAGS